jgi:alpha-1,6-mannosyltransferase
VDRALWLVLCCPLVVVDLIGGAHNDALTVALLVAGLVLLAGRSPRLGALIAGGVLVGLSVSMKTTLGVVLPFAALVAVGIPNWPGVKALVIRGGTVMAAGLGTLLALSAASGLGLGWIKALSHAGDSVVWTSPPTAVGLAIGYLFRPFGVHLHAESVTRLIALVALPIVLAVILWHTRNHDPLYGAGLAVLATIFLAPIVQPWYLLWSLTLFAVTRANIRWFLIAVAIGSSIILPDGSGLTKFLQLPGSFVMTAVVTVVIVRSVGWLRGYEPTEIDFDALRAERAAAPPAAPLGRKVDGLARRPA